MLDGRGSLFKVAAADETLDRRAARLEIHATGPLWGRATAGPGRGRSSSASARSSRRVRAVRTGWHAAGAPEPAACVSRSYDWAAEAQAVVLRFHLARGSFATAVLRELIASPRSGGKESVTDH